MTNKPSPTISGCSSPSGWATAHSFWLATTGAGRSRSRWLPRIRKRCAGLSSWTWSSRVQGVISRKAADAGITSFTSPDLPEALTQGRERVYLSWFYKTFAYRPDAIGPEDLEEYLRTYSEPGAMRAGFAYYRALAKDAADNQAFLTGDKLAMPVLAIGGAVSYPHGRGRGSAPEQSLRRAATDVRGEVIADCGHFIPEEAPDQLAQGLLRFFAEESKVDG